MLIKYKSVYTFNKLNKQRYFNYFYYKFLFKTVIFFIIFFIINFIIFLFNN